MAFVRRPRFINNEDGIQLYEDKERDENAKRPFERNVAVIGIVILMCLAMSYRDSTLIEFVTNVPLFLVFGTLLSWTFIEYFFHRFILHTEIDLDKNAEADPK